MRAGLAVDAGDIGEHNAHVLAAVFVRAAGGGRQRVDDDKAQGHVVPGGQRLDFGDQRRRVALGPIEVDGRLQQHERDALAGGNAEVPAIGAQAFLDAARAFSSLIDDEALQRVRAEKVRASHDRHAGMDRQEALPRARGPANDRLLAGRQESIDQIFVLRARLIERFPRERAELGGEGLLEGIAGMGVDEGVKAIDRPAGGAPVDEVALGRQARQIQHADGLEDGH